MLTFTTIPELRAAIAAARTGGATTGFIPTMGFLHEGHLSLVDLARDAGATFVVVSIFVNPLQFGPAEDLSRYPRDEERDRSLLESRKVDLLFLPSIDVMYPKGSQTIVDPGPVAKTLEGERRPGHFAGVATVVLKLFNIVQPDLAVFGRKDAQQCAVIERMTRDLDLPLRIIFAETMRESDGLAMSSRNSYLSPGDREAAPALHRALRAGEDAIARGSTDCQAIDAIMRAVAEKTAGVKVDYLTVVDPLTFARPTGFQRDLLLAGAIHLGKTRLIDNLRISWPQP